MSHPRENILGVQVSALNIDLALNYFDCWLQERQFHYVCVTPAHSIMDGYNQPKLRDIFNASDMAVPDGMAIVWILRFKGYSHVQRVYGPDLLLAVCKHGMERGYRHFFYGGASGIAEKLVTEISGRFPGIQIAGSYSPPFCNLAVEEDQRIICTINDTRPDIVWVGLGSPKQEVWMYDHLGKIHAPVMIGIGAAFDFLSGNKPQAPVWMQRSGLEWLFRLANEPRRLWPRYRQYPKFVLLVIAEMLSRKALQRSSYR